MASSKTLTSGTMEQQGKGPQMEHDRATDHTWNTADHNGAPRKSTGHSV